MEDEGGFGTTNTQFGKYADEEAVKEAYEKELADKAAAAEKAEREEEEEKAENRGVDDDEIFNIDMDEIDAELAKLQNDLLDSIEKELEEKEEADPVEKMKDKIEDKKIEKMEEAMEKQNESA